MIDLWCDKKYLSLNLIFTGKDWDNSTTEEK